MNGSHQTHVEVPPNVQKSAKLRERDRWVCGGFPQCREVNRFKGTLPQDGLPVEPLMVKQGQKLGPFLINSEGGKKYLFVAHNLFHGSSKVHVRGS